MKKCFTVFITTLLFLFSKAQFNNSSIVLMRADSMRFEKDTLFGFAINPSLKKSNKSWKGKNDIVLNHFAKIFKSRCDTANLFCYICKYVPACYNSPSEAINIIENIKAYLVKKCGVPEKNIIATTNIDGGPENFEYKRKKVPFIEIIIHKETL